MKMQFSSKLAGSLVIIGVSSILASAHAQDRRAQQLTLRIESSADEGVRLAFYCDQHKQFESWGTRGREVWKNIPRKPKALDVTLAHPGKYRVFLRTRSNSDVELGEYEFSEKTRPLVLKAAYLTEEVMDRQRRKRQITKKTYLLEEKHE